MLSDYFDGTDALGADDVGVPFYDDSADIGVPYVMGEDFLSIERAFADVLGQEVLGFIDIQQSQRQMNDLKAVTVGVAQALLKGGYDAINGAIRRAQEKGLPLASSRDKVLGKLNWHRDNLGKFADRMAPYPSANDLKTWVMQAFIETNAVEEGSLYADQAWAQMWNEISTELAKMPQKIREETAKVIANVTGIPVWGWALVATGGLVLIGGVLYAIINSRAGATVAGIAAKRYIP